MQRAMHSANRSERPAPGGEMTLWKTGAMKDLDDRCADCGFDQELYSTSDTRTSQHTIAPILGAAIEGLSDEMLHHTGSDQSASIAQTVAGVHDAASHIAAALKAAAIGDAAVGAATQSGNHEPAMKLDAADVAATLAATSAAFDTIQEMLSIFETMAPDQQQNLSTTVGDKDTTVGQAARHVLHVGMHALFDVGRQRHALGAGAPTEQGTVAQISVSAGGVPKLPVPTASVCAAGLSGDSQNDRRHHGRPLQAVCLWSAEVIAALRDEGHPIAAGNVGENITVAGINWPSLQPGSLIQIGNVPMLITAHAIPCAKNAQWFTDREFNRILHDRAPGFSRLYAVPLRRGNVATGDPVIVEPLTY